MQKKILVVSDSHRLSGNLSKALYDEAGNYDTVLHLGDIEGKDFELRQEIDRIDPLIAFSFVRGNCDDDISVPYFRVLRFGKLRVFMTHGHRYINKVPGGPYDALASAALENGCKVALFGHVHIPVDETAWNGVRLLNPGSIALPRQSDGRHGYGILTVSENGSFDWAQKYTEDYA